MSESVTYRCSQLPTVWLCPESGNPQPGEVVLNLSNEPAETGTAFHRWMAAHIDGTELDQDSLAREHGVDADELKMLCAMGCKALAELGRYLEKSEDPLRTEVALMTALDEHATIVGSGDIVGRQGDTLLIVDWKTGRLDTDFAHQLRGYALSAVGEMSAATGHQFSDVVVITVYVRQGVWDVDKLTVDQLNAWAQEFSRRIKNGRGTFNPGAHCQYCRRASSCPGRREMVRAACADLQVAEWTPETRLASGPKIGETLGKLKILVDLAEQFRAVVKEDVLQHGPLPTGPGRQLAILTVNKRELDAGKARPVLSKWLTADEIDAETKISVSGCEAAAVEKAPKGQGAATKRSIAAALETAGAISINEIQQLREGKAP